MTDLEQFPQDWQRALVIVAHPDDPEYGMGAAVAQWTAEGKEVSYVLATRGEAGIAGMAAEESGPLRSMEQQNACARVGVSDLVFLDHPDGRIEEGLALRRDFAREIRRARPDLVLTLNHRDEWGPGRWNSADHRAVGRAVLDAVGDADNDWIFPELLAEGLARHKMRWVAISSRSLPTLKKCRKPVSRKPWLPWLNTVNTSAPLAMRPWRSRPGSKRRW